MNSEYTDVKLRALNGTHVDVVLSLEADEGGPASVTLGRNPKFRIASKKVSRNHVTVRTIRETANSLLHVNPVFIRQSGKPERLLRKSDSILLGAGDIISLLSDNEYSYEIENCSSALNVPGSPTNPAATAVSTTTVKHSPSSSIDTKPCVKTESTGAPNGYSGRTSDIRSSETNTRRRVLPGWMYEAAAAEREQHPDTTTPVSSHRASTSSPAKRRRPGGASSPVAAVFSKPDSAMMRGGGDFADDTILEAEPCHSINSGKAPLYATASVSPFDDISSAADLERRRRLRNTPSPPAHEPPNRSTTPPVSEVIDDPLKEHVPSPAESRLPALVRVRDRYFERTNRDGNAAEDDDIKDPIQPSTSPTMPPRPPTPTSAVNGLSPTPPPPAAAAPPSYSQTQPFAAVTTPPRDRCRFGAQCYRKNPAHFVEFCHPKDEDWDSHADSSQSQDAVKRVCPYGAQCYRTNPNHLRDFDHPTTISKRLRKRQPKPQTNKGGGYASGGDDSFDGSFIDDASDSDATSEYSHPSDDYQPDPKDIAAGESSDSELDDNSQSGPVGDTAAGEEPDSLTELRSDAFNFIKRTAAK